MSALRIEVEDRGQDFLSFTFRDGTIQEANLQGFVWNGKKLANRAFRRGCRVRFEDGSVLSYRVVRVTKIE